MELLWDLFKDFMPQISLVRQYFGAPGDTSQHNQQISASGITPVWTPNAGNFIQITDFILSTSAVNTVYLIGAINGTVSSQRAGPFYLNISSAAIPFNLTAPLILSANEVLNVSCVNSTSVGVTFTGYEARLDALGQYPY